MQVQIGERVFETKKAALQAVQAVLYSYSVGQFLGPEDQCFIADVLAKHPDATRKIGSGVKAFQIRDCGWGTKCFWLHRTDGTDTDFSFMKCLTPPGPREKALNGLRREIADQTIEFKQVQFSDGSTVKCVITGESVGWHDCHVDHELPFRQLVDDFCKTCGLRLEEMRVNATEDGEVETRLANQDVADLWASYHATHAKLRITTKHANLSRPK